jgi:hypothetical protein
MYAGVLLHRPILLLFLILLGFFNLLPFCLDYMVETHHKSSIRIQRTSAVNAPRTYLNVSHNWEGSCIFVAHFIHCNEEDLWRPFW